MNYAKPLSFAAAGLIACGIAFPGSDHLLSPKPHKKVPTFATDVAPILYGKCAKCHHAGEVAPFSLTSYAEARAKAGTIAAVVQQRYMPPWQAVSHGQFLDERTLTPKQIQTISEWAEAGAPPGDLAQAPKVPAFTPGWQMGPPDFVGEPDRSYPIAAEGSDDYRCFVIPTRFSEDRYVTGIELRPGNRKVVHHVLIYIDTKGIARRKVSKDGKPGYESFGGPGFAPSGSLGGWAPGIEPQILAPGTGFLLPKGADLVLQMHYHKDGKPETDLTRLGLKFAKTPIDKKVRWDAVGEVFLDIPPGDPKYEVRASLKVPRAITLMDVIPHMHWLGHDMEVTATLPDGSTKQLIDVDHYDFNWQTRYAYRDPVHIPAGTTLSLVAHYDNSSNNIHNPNEPPKRVTFGEQTTDEMCYAFFSYTVDAEHLASGQKVQDLDDFGETESALSRVFDRFDTDHDGYLEPDELATLISFFSGKPVDANGKPVDMTGQAKMAIAFYGRTVKGKLTRSEFIKMAKNRNN